MGLRNLIRNAIFRRYPGLYWRRRAASYYVHREESGYLRLVHEAIVDRVVSLRPARVLEYGVGNASLLKKIHDRLPEAQYWGTDVSTAHLEAARQRFPEAIFSAGDLRQLEYADNSFDVVIGVGVLIYLPARTRPRAFRELHRVTKGHVIAAEYITKYFDDEMLRRYRNVADFRTDYDIEGCFRVAGFTSVEVCKLDAAWSPTTNPLGGLPHGIIVARK